MVGLSVILENYKDLSAKKTPQVISKGSMIKPPSSSPSSPSSATPLSPLGFSRRKTKTLTDLGSSSGFLDHCSLCKQKLLPGKDIYMYKGDRAFCSVECRCRQIFMDEEESTTSREYNCSLAARKQPHQATSTPSSSRSGRGPRNRSNAFAC
ncbi:hypothetical protein Pfo_015922 [Paulownia fortunei]|nr:hypothetical protein Pfo_015922 [Paulownia fortunei]